MFGGMGLVATVTYHSVRAVRRLLFKISNTFLGDSVFGDHTDVLMHGLDTDLIDLMVWAAIVVALTVVVTVLLFA